MFGLHGLKLHRHLVDGAVKSVWFRQVFDLHRVWFRQVSMYLQVVKCCNIDIKVADFWKQLQCFHAWCAELSKS